MKCERRSKQLFTRAIQAKRASSLSLKNKRSKLYTAAERKERMGGSLKLYQRLIFIVCFQYFFQYLYSLSKLSLDEDRTYNQKGCKE